MRESYKLGVGDNVATHSHDCCSLLSSEWSGTGGSAVLWDIRLQEPYISSENAWNIATNP